VELSTNKFEPNQNTKISITVKDDDTQEPIAGATVTLKSGANQKSVTTDEKGFVEIQFTSTETKTTLTITDGVHTDYEKTFP